MFMCMVHDSTNDKPNNIIIMRSVYGGQNVHTMFAGELLTFKTIINSSAEEKAWG